MHDGLDIAVDEGTSVLAVQDGVVTRVYHSATFGNVLMYKTKDGYDIMYAHLKQSVVNEGDEIEQGQVVALSGNTGLTTGPHLHYTILKDGDYLNPSKFVN